jgi:hypothetical protein
MPLIFFGFALGETAATGGGMRRRQASPAAKPLEHQGLETPEEKNSPIPQIFTDA